MPRGVYKRKLKVKAEKKARLKEIKAVEMDYELARDGIFPYENAPAEKRIELLLRDCLDNRDKLKMLNEEYRLNQEEIKGLTDRCYRYERIIDKLTGK